MIVNKWTAVRTATIETLKDAKDIDVAGGGNFDSPGWCVKFCTYSIMHMASGAILDFFV